LFVVGWVAASGCGRCGFQPDPGVKIVVPAMPSTLDWETSDLTSWSNYPVLLATMRGLTSLDSNNRIGPGLATNWEREETPDGHEIYTFHLRNDVKWSDGVNSLCAQDFVVGWRRSMVGRERAEMTDLLGGYEVLARLEAGAAAAEVERALEKLGVEAIDNRTLRVTLARPRSYFLARIANVYLFFPAPSADLIGRSSEEIEDYFDRPRDGKPRALGPFRVESWDRAGERVRLVANPSSSFAPPVSPGEERPTVVTFMKSEIGQALYERGRVDFTFVDSPEALVEKPSPDLRRQTLLSTYFLAFNTERPPLNRAEVRRALSLALNRAALVAGILPASRPAESLLPPDLPGAGNAQARNLYQPERARELLKRGGVPQRPLRLERIRSQLGKLGVRVELDARYDFSNEICRRAADGLLAPDMYLRRIGADYAHPKTFFTLFEGGGNHCTGWESLEGGAALRRFETILARADAVPDPSDAAELYGQAESILVDEQAVIAPLYYPDRYYLVRPSLVGLTVDRFNFLSVRDLRRKRN
jgi:ABC-type oligopeptide transport system substrate-binding subunit